MLALCTECCTNRYYRLICQKMSDPNFFIETPRLYISYFRPDLDSHCDFLVDLYNTPEFIAGAGKTNITTREIARERLTRFLKDHERNGYGIYLVSRKPDVPDADAPFPERLARATLVGTVSLMRGSSPTAYKAPDLGFAIHARETRKGYAKEAALGLLAYGKEHLGVPIALGITDPKNAPSKAVFRSMGWEDRGERSLVEFGGAVCAVWTPPEAEPLESYGM